MMKRRMRLALAAIGMLALAGFASQVHGYESASAAKPPAAGKPSQGPTDTARLEEW